MSGWATSPQAAQIDAVIERAGRLTVAECHRLIADRAATWYAAKAADRAWYADRVAASSAARDAAKAADRDLVAVRVAARDAVEVSVRDREAAWVAAITAEALAVRNLIDEATEWNQEAYDLLTGPWRRVIGPIHPDDEVLR